MMVLFARGDGVGVEGDRRIPNASDHLVLAEEAALHVRGPRLLDQLSRNLRLARPEHPSERAHRDRFTADGHGTRTHACPGVGGVSSRQTREPPTPLAAV